MIGIQKTRKATFASLFGSSRTESAATQKQLANISDQISDNVISLNDIGDGNSGDAPVLIMNDEKVALKEEDFDLESAMDVVKKEDNSTESVTQIDHKNKLVGAACDLAYLKSLVSILAYL
ncbi:hypothetical protein O9G_004500 [Rozella allomycis CSF55]|uniref:Uncharacterized protein n=1 Tax=Rozella allomycis (strain CSF55) TaxID=988480 RepID=A0A075B4Q1_ROZAC|nr:hypothetical protein O9G_004500 [Rozella allomycis CSF55]|eukprot:EPZ36374.1 hypothetical protein O9G_004500 [Rozella allomycis CSF55]